MSLIPAMFQYIKKIVGTNSEKQIAFAPLATPFTNEDFLFLDAEVYQRDPGRFYDEASEFSQKANSIVKKAGVWEIDSDNFLYDRYAEILNNARLIDDRDFNQDELEKQQSARKILYGADDLPTESFVRYKSFEKQYKQILQNVQSHQASEPSDRALWEAKLSELEDALRDKELEWKALGAKAVIENAMKAFDEPKENAERSAFAVQWQEAKTIFNTLKAENISSGAEIYPMGCIPNNLYQYNQQPWAKVHLNKNEIDALTEEFENNPESEALRSVFDQDDFVTLESIAFDICRVVLSRAWFKENLLFSKYWDYPGVQVSTSDTQSFRGTIPAYPTEFILVRNITPELAANSPGNETIKSELLAGSAVFLGPFLLKNAVASQLNPNVLQVQNYTAQQLKVLAGVPGQSITVHDRRTKKAAMGVLKTVHSNSMQKALSARSSLMLNAEKSPRLFRPTSNSGGRLTKPFEREGYIWVVDHWERKRAHPPVGFRLSGKIVDEKNTPIAGAQIDILSAALTIPKTFPTDEKGMFLDPTLKPGTYHLTVRKEGYSILERDIVLTGNLDLNALSINSIKPIDSFLLLGVVYKKLPKLPDPIPGEKYF